MEIPKTMTITKVVVVSTINYIGNEVDKIIQAIQNLKNPPLTLKCPKCGREIESKSFALHLTKHVRITGKQCVCDICGEKLPSYEKFLRHVREHLVFAIYRNGMYVWYCTLCGHEFTSKKSAVVHILKAHEVE